MLLLEVPGEVTVAHLPQWAPHGVSQAHQWIARLAGLVMVTDHHHHVPGQEMGRGILALVGHLQDTKAGFLTTTCEGIGWITLMRILGTVASLRGHLHQSGAQGIMDEMAFWTEKDMRGDHYLHLRLHRLHLVEDGQIVT